MDGSCAEEFAGELVMDCAAVASGGSDMMVTATFLVAARRAAERSGLKSHRRPSPRSSSLNASG